MKEKWIAPEQLFDGQTVLTGHAIRIADDRVVEVGPAPKFTQTLKGCLTPGFVDLQVNGGGGVMLNSTPTREGMAKMAAAHRRFGTVAIMPTLITDAPELLEQVVDAAIAARRDEGIVGLHIEGPHIAVARRGTHNANFVRVLDDRTMSIVAHLRDNDVSTMITLAPEAATNEQIATLSKMGAIVSIGHTDSNAEGIEAAIAAGARCATHLFNAMSPMTSRAPGAVGTIINSTLKSGIICDGHHVDDRMIAMALRARPEADLMFLVSDSMATVGGPKRFGLYGNNVNLVNGRLLNSEGALAGAHITQREGVARLVKHVGLSLQDALRMAITVPAQVIGKTKLSDIVGQRTKDLIVLSDNLKRAVTLAKAPITTLVHDPAG